MTGAVRLTLVKSGLELKSKRPGGIRVSDALARADANVGGLKDTSLNLIRSGLDDLLAMAGEGRVRPSDEALDAIVSRSNKMLSYATPLNNAVVVQHLHGLCRLAEAVKTSKLWLVGTFPPVILATRLAVDGGLSESQSGSLLEEVYRCIAKYAEKSDAPPPQKTARAEERPPSRD